MVIFQLVPSGLWKKYVKNKDIYIKVWKEIVESLLEHEGLRNKKLFCLVMF